MAIAGGPGSGKSTLARAVASQLGAPVVELDALWWRPEWTPAEVKDFRDKVAQTAESSTWVIEGNYLAEVGCDIVWRRADTLVWLDLPRRLAVGRALRRTFVRVARREQLWATNRQPLSALSPSSVGRLVRRWPEYSRRIAAALDVDVYPHLKVVRLRSDREVADWLAAIQPVNDSM
ncbi:MAG TPA: AAA family ATPase [Acidimicrobiales bacterium]|nr:AAA family ATPase [Acidimicrobiales bacterium]